jgi:ribosomal protein S18 acetylase RimI-like enzyme
MLEIIKVQKEGAELESIRQLFRDYLKELNEDLCFQSFDKEVRDPLQKYGPPSGALFLALWKMELAGCIALTALPENGVCEMKRLYVVPAFRKLGIARHLVAQLQEAAITIGYSCMKLDTLERLQPAIRLYQEFGFTITRAYYSNPISQVVYMEKNLLDSVKNHS